jgi:phage terminase large subunit
VHLWSRQREIVESVRDHRKTAVRSGHGTGKTVSAATTLLWFLDTHPQSRVVTTATKWSQVKTLLWHEVGMLWHQGAGREHARGRPIFRRAPLQTELTLPDGRYALGIASKPENSESFGGHHAPHILLIYDEASGVNASIFEAGEGYMTTDGARMLLIGNPTRENGEFFDAFHSKRGEYHTIHISVLESPAITGEPVPESLRVALTGQEWVDSRRKSWGQDSPTFKVRVLGQFADLTGDTVIGLAAVEDAQARDLEPEPDAAVVIGVDVARFGSDETVICERVGQRIRILEHYVGKATTHTSGRVMHWASRHEHARVVVDDPGVGGGVTDQLRAAGMDVTAFNGAEAAHRPLQFPNRRSELWLEAAAQLEDLDLDDDDQLAADLTSPKYGYDLKLRRVVEKKDETKKRLGRSPDRADAVILTLVAPRAGQLLVPARSAMPRRHLAQRANRGGRW